MTGPAGRHANVRSGDSPERPIHRKSIDNLMAGA